MQSKESYDKFYLSYKKRCGVKATINNKEIEVFFKEIDDKVNESTDYKYMFADYGQYKQGNLIKIYDSYYLAINKEENLNNNTLYEKFTVRRCQAIKFKSIIIYGLVDSKIFDINQSFKYFDLVDNQILVQISNDNRIQLDDRIQYNNKTYRVIAINDTVENCLILKCQYDKPTHTYKLKLNTSDIITIQEGQTYQVQVTPYIDDNVDSAAVIEYISLDTSIVQIDNKGLITAIKQGVTSVKAKYQDVEEVVNINVLPVPKVQYLIQGSDTLDSTLFQKYVIVDKDNNIVTDKEFSLKINAPVGRTWSDFISNINYGFNTNYFLGKETTMTFDLQATCKTDSNIVIKKTINVVNSYDYDYKIIGDSNIVYRGNKTYQVANKNKEPITDKTFIFSLEKSCVNDIETNVLIREMSNITNNSVRLNAAYGTKGWVTLVAKCNEDRNIILKQDIQIKER